MRDPEALEPDSPSHGKAKRPRAIQGLPQVIPKAQFADMRILSVPLWLAEDHRLNATAVRVALALSRWAFDRKLGIPTDHVWSTNRTIGSQIGTDAKTAKRALTDLVNTGWIRLKPDKTCTKRTIILLWMHPRFIDPRP